MGNSCASCQGSQETDDIRVAEEKEFRVEFEKGPDDSVGVDIDIGDGATALIVNILEDGIMHKWNQRQPPGKQVQPGDHVIEVNGSRGQANTLVKLLKREGKLSLIVQRPREFQVEITKEKDESLGLDVSWSETGKTLLINSCGGRAQEWNVSHPEAALKPNDRIVAVNGKRGPSQEVLITQVQNKEKAVLKLTISRCRL